MAQVSIIIPVYNSEKTLGDCLQSIYAQTFDDFEIIAVNDGSSDNSLDILKKHHKRVSIVNQENHGAASARNTGAKVAKAQYLLFCDADIILKPNFLLDLKTALDHNESASFAYCDFKFGFKKFQVPNFNPELLKKMPYIHTTTLIRTRDFPGFDEKLKRFQDWDLFLTMAKNGKKGIHIAKLLFVVKSGGSMSRWFPSFFLKLPFLPSVKKYNQAKKIIQAKHGL